MVATETAPEVRNAIDPLSIDLSRVQQDFEAALSRLLDGWSGQVVPRQVDEIVDQVRARVSRGDIEALASMSASTDEAQALLVEAMTQMGLSAAREMAREAADQGVHLDPAAARDHAPVANAVASLLETTLATAAGREAVRLLPATSSGVDVDAVVRGVRDHLGSLSSAFAELNLGGALGKAETAGRLDTIEDGPVAMLYGSEILDRVTCAPCRQINGKWLGRSDQMEQVERIYPGGYVDCLGGVRCRGQVVAIWADEQGRRRKPEKTPYAAPTIDQHTLDEFAAQEAMDAEDAAKGAST